MDVHIHADIIYVYIKYLALTLDFKSLLVAVDTRMLSINCKTANNKNTINLTINTGYSNDDTSHKHTPVGMLFRNSDRRIPFLEDMTLVDIVSNCMDMI